MALYYAERLYGNTIHVQNFIEHVVPDFTLMSSDDLVENILNHLCDEYGVKEMLLTYDVD